MPQHNANQLFASYSEFFGLSLRDQQHVARTVTAAITGIKTGRAHIHYLFFLSMLNYRFPESFRRIFQKPADDNNFNEEINKITKKPVFFENSWNRGTISLETVALFYFKTARRTLKELLHEETDDVGFPQNLVQALVGDMPRNAPLEKPFLLDQYPALVRQAGHFG